MLEIGDKVTCTNKKEDYIVDSNIIEGETIGEVMGIDEGAATVKWDDEIWDHSQQYLTVVSKVPPTSYPRRKGYDSNYMDPPTPVEPTENPDMGKASKLQVGGNHYKQYEIQPVEYSQRNRLNYCEANVVKYITRWRDKGGLEDLEKVKHYVDLLIELEYGDEQDL